MKRKHLLSTLLFTAVAGIGYITFSSYTNGAGNGGYDCTGAETGLSNLPGCGQTVGCHSMSATTGITVALELDSTGGVPVTQYVPGMTYTIKITGTNTTANSLPKFGFQVAVINGSTAQTTPTNAGQLQTTVTTPLRYTTAQANNFVTNLIEHRTPIAATSGTGGAGTTYVESFNWTAPAAGTGTVSIWGVVNAVNGNNSTSGDFWNTNHTVINEGVASSSCDTVHGLAASATSSTTINATWTASTGGLGYEYAINTTGVTPTAAQGATTTLSHSFTGLTPNTNYTVFVRDSCGAGNFSAWKSVAVHTPLGVNNIGFENMSISAYPNPVVNNLNIKMEHAASGTYYVRIINIAGQVVLNQAIVVNSSNFETTINTSSFANGTYALQIAKDGAMHTTAFVKH